MLKSGYNKPGPTTHATTQEIKKLTSTNQLQASKINNMQVELDKV